MITSNAAVLEEIRSAQDLIVLMNDGRGFLDSRKELIRARTFDPQKRTRVVFLHTIWHIVASKHWHDFEVPINVMTNENWSPLAKGEEVFREGNTTITVWTLDDRPNIQTNIILERQDIFWHPNTYPEIEELQRALSSIPKKIEQEHNYITFGMDLLLKLAFKKRPLSYSLRRERQTYPSQSPNGRACRRCLIKRSHRETFPCVWLRSNFSTVQASEPLNQQAF